MTVTSSQLKRVISIDPFQNAIFDHTSELEKGVTELFVASQHPQHILFLGHEFLFNLKKKREVDNVKILLKILRSDKNLTSDKIVWNIAILILQQERAGGYPLRGVLMNREVLK